jgi:hypothetical protein
MGGYADLVLVVGTILCVLGIVLCWRISRVRFTELPAQERVRIANARVSPVAFWKLVAFAAFVAVPLATMGAANYHTFRGTHEVAACARCHIMRPMVNDMRDPASDTLAARHFRNRWIAQDQCFHCHSDYGLSGDLEAKATGFRHLARYTTGRYMEPIAMRVAYNNRNCLKCHGDTPAFERGRSHQDVRDLLEASGMSCTNCHGQAHPTRAQRTPGSADYDRLMEAYHE